MSKMKKRADGRYCKEVYLDKLPDGKYHRVAVYGKTQKEVLEKAAKIKADFEQGILIENPNMTFREMGELWIGNCKPDVSQAHRNSYIAILKNHLYPAFGSIKLKELKPLHLQIVINAMSVSGYATATMKNIRMTARQILETAIENNLMRKNVFKKITIPSKPEKERRALDDAEIRLVTENWRGHRMCLAAMIMLYCGLRRGEVSALRWEDIDMANRLITVSKSAQMDINQPVLKLPKTEAGIRQVPIPEVLMVALRHERKASGLVCTMSDGQSMMTKCGWKRGWDGYLYFLNLQAGGKPAAGGKGVVWVIDKSITAHQLRHTYATLLFDAGVDVKSAQQYLGHSCLEVTLEIYTHLSRFKKAQSVDALNKHLGERGIEQTAKLKAV